MSLALVALVSMPVAPILAAAEDAPVAVFAAASLTEAFRAIGAALHADNPDLTAEFNFAASSMLATQIEQGAPAAVFASADEPSMERVAKANLLDGQASVFARNRLTIVVPRGNPGHVAGLGDLARAGLVVSLCAPAVPCGKYAEEAFGKAGVKMPEAIREADVKAVLTRVRLGEADAGIVYVTDARAAAAQVETIDIPEAHNVLARYPIAVVKSAPDTKRARAFVRFALSDRGQEILARSGFLGR
jgi:molybdate transport system substrate-binding protein